MALQNFVSFSDNSATLDYASDGIAWTNVGVTGIGSTLKYGTYGDGYYVMVTAGATNSYYSTDGITWSQGGVLPGTSYAWSSIVYGRDNTGTSKFVALSPSGGAFTTDHGLTWTAFAAPSTLSKIITFGNGIYLTVSGDGTGSSSSRSTDGITWTAGGSMPTLKRWGPSCYGAGKFIAINSGDTSGAISTGGAYSIDNGATWTAFTLPYPINCTSIAYGANRFVAIDWNGLAVTSVDGITWTYSTLNGSTGWNAVGYHNDRFVVTNYSTPNHTCYSADGANWTYTTITKSVSSSVATTGNPINTSFNSAIATSTGISTLLLPWLKGWSFIWAATKWIGVKGYTNTAVTSPDGVTWTSHTLPASLKWSALASVGSLYATIAKDSAVAATTPDGVTWTSRTLPNTRAWTSMASSATTFVAVAAASGFCVTSTDGITWTEHAMPFDQWVSVAYNGTNTFCAITNTGNSAISIDNGATWTAHTMPDAISYTCVAWVLGQFTAVAMGPTNLAATSVDGVTWTRITMPAVDDWISVGPGAGTPDA